MKTYSVGDDVSVTLTKPVYAIQSQKGFTLKETSLESAHASEKI